MSLYDYKVSQELDKADTPFYALIMAAMRRADTDNLSRFKALFPQTFEELKKRYNAPGGQLPEDGG